MRLAKIVSSNSHIEYIGRVIDKLDDENAPANTDYGFGTFVAIGHVVGIIFNSILVNPDYASFGPRLSSKEDLFVLSPDFINERGVLINILLLGSLTDGHNIPEFVIEPGSDVRAMNELEVFDFHKNAVGNLQIGYFARVTENAGNFAVPLLNAVIKRLTANCDESDAQRLKLLKDSLNWQQTVGGFNFR